MSWGVFVGVTVIIAGGAAWLMGQALASTWRPLWQVFIYGFLLGLADRFIIYALFEGELLSAAGFLIDFITLLCIALLAYRTTQVKKMVSQYPWLYRRKSPFNWAEQDSADSGNPIS